jgi:protein TonB
MSLEPQPVFIKTQGVLQSCLVESDPEQRARERKVRRRALTVSVVLQSAVIATVVMLPLIGRPERIALAGTISPIPPYPRVHARNSSTSQSHTGGVQIACRFCPTFAKPHASSKTSSQEPENDLVDIGDRSIGLPDGLNDSLFESRRGPQPPHAPPTTVSTPRVAHTTHVDPAMLTYRAEPAYPTLARQLGRSGQVELRAIIATDGTIQSLQVVSGDPLFYKSALEAVRQWRYKPTVLNGEPVEVDTFITVIYKLE